MVLFGLEPLVNPFGKMSIFRLFELLVFIAQKGFFFIQNIVKDIFLAYIALKQSWKNGHFWTQNHGLATFRKMSIFSLFKFFFLKARRRFSVQEYRNRHFPSLYCVKEKWKNGHFLTQNHGLATFRKMSIFSLFKFFFLKARRRFSVQEYRNRHFPSLYCVKKKWKNGHFWTKTMG